MLRRNRPISNENRKEFSIPSFQRSMNEKLENTGSSSELVHTERINLESNIAEGDPPPASQIADLDRPLISGMCTKV